VTVIAGVPVLLCCITIMDRLTLSGTAERWDLPCLFNSVRSRAVAYHQQHDVSRIVLISNKERNWEGSEKNKITI
jgi:hypothetical protein